MCEDVWDDVPVVVAVVFVSVWVEVADEVTVDDCVL